MEKCISCGLPYHRHLGLTGTCRELQAEKLRTSSLEQQVAALTAQRDWLLSQCESQNSCVAAVFASESRAAGKE